MSDAIMEDSVELLQQRTNENIFIGSGCRLGLADAYLMAKNSPKVSISPNATIFMAQSFQYLLSCIESRLPIYGVNTHFGDQVSFLDPHLKNTNDPNPYFDSINLRQENIIKSLSCGLGTILPAEIIKVAMMLRAHCLAQGYSGVTENAVQSILNFINCGIVPVVRCYGSIGASGDLIPLAMIAAAISGENVGVFYKNELMPAFKAIELAGLHKFKPVYRDGLAMINGTSFMTAIAALSLYALRRLFKQMLYAIAMSLESLLVIESGYHPFVHQLKQQHGQCCVNSFLQEFWEGSQLLTNLDELRNSGDFSKNNKSFQDFYSIRSVAQGFGPFYENLERATTWIENEMNSVNDNPIIDVASQKIHHNANFMGYYVTDSCDILKMNIAQASTWIHALLANLVHPRKSHDLPANLVLDPGKNNGFRSFQLLAAALAVQNRKFAQSHQAYMLPTEGDNQDVNSLGTHAALDFRESVANLERLVAILLLASAQALELRGIEQASPKAQGIYHLIRQHSKTITDCRPMSDEMEIIINLLRDEKI